MTTKSTKFHNKISKEYEKEYQTPYWNLYNEITWHHIKKYLPKEKKYPILDAGGGTGYWSRKLAKLGFSVVCSDIAKEMLKTGKETIKNTSLEEKIDFVFSDITNMKEFKNNSFSMVIAEGDPVGYCGSPQKAIKELTRVARKGASIIVSVDGFLSMIGNVIKNNKLEQLPKLLKTHLSDFFGEFPQYHFTVDELKQMYSQNNIAIKSIIGKTIFTGFIPQEKRNKLLSNKNFYKKILKLEIQFNSDPSLIGVASHIEIAGIKT